jgi:predicted ArsR family transcriptional regulator
MPRVAEDHLLAIIMMKMSSVEPRSRRHRRPDRRSAIVAVLRAADGPLGVEQIAVATGIAESTAQFHLSLLVGAGQVLRAALRTGSAGRPAWRYKVPDGTSTAAPAVASAPATPYVELARALAAQLGAGADADASARDAGRRWAEVLPLGAERPASGPEEAAASLSAVLGRLGFAPELQAAAGEIVLHACPFEAVAREHRQVVCSVHLGLVERAAAAIGGGVAIIGLEPFRTDHPLACAVRLQIPAPPLPALEVSP